MKTMMFVLCAAAATALTFSSCGKHERQNPFMKAYDNKYQIPPFEEIQISDYEPAFEAGIAEANAAIDSIVNNPRGTHVCQHHPAA